MKYAIHSHSIAHIGITSPKPPENSNHHSQLLLRFVPHRQYHVLRPLPLFPGRVLLLAQHSVLSSNLIHKPIQHHAHPMRMQAHLPTDPLAQHQLLRPQQHLSRTIGWQDEPLLMRIQKLLLLAALQLVGCGHRAEGGVHEEAQGTVQLDVRDARALERGGADLVPGNVEDGHAPDRRWGVGRQRVLVADPKTQHIEASHGPVALGRVPGPAAQHAPQRGQVALGGEQLAQAAADEACVGEPPLGGRGAGPGSRGDLPAGGGEGHVDFQEEGLGVVEVLVGEVGGAADAGDAVRVERQVHEKPHASDGVEGAGRAAEALRRELDKQVFTYALSPDNHVQPAETRDVAEVLVFFGQLQIGLPKALVLTLLLVRGVFHAEIFVATPGIDLVGVRRPSAHAGEDESGVMAIEEAMEVFASTVKLEQRREWEVGDEQEKQVVLATQSMDKTERAFGYWASVEELSCRMRAWFSQENRV
nr:hypothetical protein CFP56_30101 [Quercus suber]